MLTTSEEDARLGEGDAARVRCFRLLLVTAQRLRNLTDAALRDAGVTTQQAALLTVLRLAGPQGASLGQAASSLGTSHQNARQLVRALEAKGLVTATPDPDDKRVLRLRTTRRNERLWRDRDPADERAVLAAFAGVSAKEARQVTRVLARVYAAAAPAPPAKRRRST